VAALAAAASPAAHARVSPYLTVWVHYDYMAGQDGSFAPSAAAMQLVIAAFKAHGVTLHIDPQHTAIPEQKVIVPDWPSPDPPSAAPSCTGPDAVRFSALKTRYFHPNTNHPWHYAIFGDLVYTDSAADANNCPATPETGGAPPLPGMLGDSQLGYVDSQDADGRYFAPGLGYNFVVTLGALRTAGHIPNAVEQAAIFMHELGHNFGLQHGGAPIPGNDYTDNFKPNYISVMNYDFELGIPYAATPGSPDVTGYRADYSDVKLPDLNEADLDETAGVQDAAHPADITYSAADGFCGTPVAAFGPIDWNGDGNTTDTHVASDINCDFGQLEVLHGSDDWAWIHARLTPPAITAFTPATAAPGQAIGITGPNLLAPVTVIFTGGVTAPASANQAGPTFPGCNAPGDITDICLDVTIPPGAKSGPITILTPQGKATSSQSLTITP
jgi:hypothetical protein